MPDIKFHVESAEVVAHAAIPTVSFKLHVTNATPSEPIQTGLLRCQIRIEPTKRAYDAAEKAQLRDLFGEPERWGQTLRGMLWVHANAMVPAFDEETTIELPVPCSFDFNVAATKYFHGLNQDEIPLIFLFSGTLFHRAEPFGLQASQISWEKEATFRLSVELWKEMMDSYYPNTAWLSLHRDAFERLYRFKMSESLPTWEQALDRLFAQAGVDDE